MHTGPPEKSLLAFMGGMQRACMRVAGDQFKSFHNPGNKIQKPAPCGVWWENKKHEDGIKSRVCLLQAERLREENNLS